MQSRCFFSKAYTMVVICLLSSVFFSSHGSLLLKSAQASIKWGSEVGEFTGVKAYSNGFNHWIGYNDEEGNWHYYPIAYGCFQYQCVEYVNHFYDKIFNMTLGTGHGRDYYIRASDKGLDRYANGGDVIPRIGDILCFDDSHFANPGLKDCVWNEENQGWNCTEEEAHGHVAIIKNVGSNNIEVIQQNWHNDAKDDNKSIVYSSASNEVSNLGNYVVQGWLRKPGIAQLTSEFTTEGYTEGWMTFNLEGFSVNNLDPDQDGVFYIDPGVSDPYIVSPPLAVNSVEYDAVEIMMASNAPDGIGAIYFTTADSPRWSEDKKVDFSVTNDGNYHKCLVAMTNNPLWAATITGIRIDPANYGIGDSNEDTVGFDYIRLASYSATRTMNFEDGVDRQPIRSKIPGLRFTTTDGYDWIYGDWRAGYNGPYPNGSYFSNGNFFAWLGENQGTGRIDFTGATATYLSVLTSTYSGLTMDAYDINNNWLATSGWATNNLNTGQMTKLTIAAPNMAYVLVHDTGNYWLIDDLEIGDLLAVAKAYLPASFIAEYEDLDTLDQDQSKWKAFFNEIYQTIKIILGWGGSELSIQIYNPDGILYDEYQSDMPPIIIDIPDAEPGQWQFKITAIDVPENNYPFALVVGIPDTACPNNPPIADAGLYDPVEVGSGCVAAVSLDGSGSSDPDGDPLTYTWTWDDGSSIGSASGVNPTINLPIGTFTITLVVNDGTEDSEPDEVDITVEDTTPPATQIISPVLNQALQDGVLLTADASDACGVAEVYFYIREVDGGSGSPIGYEDLPGVYNGSSWEYNFDTNMPLTPDGYYVILTKAVDTNGNESWSAPVPVSIRNWAVVELLPNTANNKAGRTMPVKFALRIAAAVDPDQPFVYNEELEIRIYDAPDTILQTSLYGDASTDYRIDTAGELYITNFKTSKKPAEYVVEIWRMSKNFLVGSFTFETVK